MSKPSQATSDDTSPRTKPTRSILSIPPSLKRLFDEFPLVTYAANELPARSVSVPNKRDRADIHAFYDAHLSRRRSSEGGGRGGGKGQRDDALHAFFSWAGEGDVSPNVASFNPGCLRWQAYLVSQGIKFHVVPSNNHASFPHSLPLVASHPHAGGPFAQPIITSEGLGKWAKKSGEMGMKEDAFMALVDGPVRRAWLFSMYMTPNFEKLTVPCYIDAHTSSPIIRLFSARELRQAAQAELLKYKPVIDERAIYSDAEDAFQALDSYFSRREEGTKPTTLLDAAVFAYTYLLLELAEDGWADRRLADMVRGLEGLRAHKEEIRKGYFRARPPGVWRRSKMVDV
ncbi:hypothetical protein EJ08DRAFT_677645 [Tothia fuscella]|uniref:Thioredoxin-like fold domain-containing protein n=1 Tax=Tothia fuscella TaxID=1048955 RepID=A0A9P4NWE0_9PEZI|nr:hypothetical protein EJ08DRAFT_677645 [Tothia fuscella]